MNSVQRASHTVLSCQLRITQLEVQSSGEGEFPGQRQNFKLCTRAKARCIRMWGKFIGTGFSKLSGTGTQSCPAVCDPMDCSQALLTVGFSREEYWSGLPFPSPGDLPHPGMEPTSPVVLHWPAGSLPLSHMGSPLFQA